MQADLQASMILTAGRPPGDLSAREVPTSPHAGRSLGGLPTVAFGPSPGLLVAPKYLRADRPLSHVVSSFWPRNPCSKVILWYILVALDGGYPMLV